VPEAKQVMLRFSKRRQMRPPGVIQDGVEAMPKMKTKSGAAKRFRVQGSGGIKRSRAFLRHILTKKSTKRKRHLRGTTQVDASDVRAIRSMLPYA
jgi:large subunit ribosomal protein L35